MTIWDYLLPSQVDYYSVMTSLVSWALRDLCLLLEKRIYSISAFPSVTKPYKTYIVWSSKLQHRSFTQLKSHTTDRRMETHNPPPHIGSGRFRKGDTTRIGMSAQNDWLNPEDWCPMPIRASGQAWCSSMSWRIRDIWQISPQPFRLAKRQTVGLEWIRFFITFWVWGVAKATAKWQTVYWWQYFQSSEVQPALEDWRIPRPPCNLCQGAWG